MHDHDKEEKVRRPLQGVFTPLYHAHRKPPSWVIKGLLPPGLVLLVGPPKESYKSTLVVAMAAMVAGYEQTVLPTEFTAEKHGVAMLFSYEDDAGEIRHVAEEGMGIKIPNDDGILVADDPGTWRLDDPDAVEQMMEWLEERNPVLTVCDPLANFHAVEEKDAGGIIRLVSPFRRWAKENDATFLFVHHPRKLDDDRSYRASDIRGSGALFGACDGVLMLTPTKNKLQVEINAIFKKHPGWTKTIDIAAWEKRGEQGHVALKEVDKILIKVIRQGAGSIAEIARDSTVAEQTVTKRMEFLKQQGIIKHESRRIVLTKKGAA